MRTWAGAIRDRNAGCRGSLAPQVPLSLSSHTVLLAAPSVVLDCRLSLWCGATVLVLSPSLKLTVPPPTSPLRPVVFRSRSSQTITAMLSTSTSATAACRGGTKRSWRLRPLRGCRRPSAPSCMRMPLRSQSTSGAHGAAPPCLILVSRLLSGGGHRGPPTLQADEAGNSWVQTDRGGRGRKSDKRKFLTLI